MKNLLFLFLILTISVCAQKKNKHENKNLTILTNKKIESSKIWITLYQSFDEYPTFFNLFQENNFSSEKTFEFPNKSGFYYLSIIYDMKHQYKEIIYYKKNPENEKLSFNIFRKKGKIYCKISSQESMEFNKEIVLKKINSNEIENTINSIREKK